MKIKDLKKGDFFMKGKAPYPKSWRQVWVRGDYDRSTKTYECHRYDDVNDTQFIRGDREVHVDFVF